jgi:hypothetical protein
MPQLSETFNQNPVLLSPGVAAGTTTVYPTAHQTKNGTNIVITVIVGTITSTGVLVLTPQYSVDGTNYTDVTAQAVTFADTDDDKIAVFDFINIPPKVTHVRVKMARTVANTVITAVLGQATDSRKTHPIGETGASALDSTVKGLKKVMIDV